MLLMTMSFRAPSLLVSLSLSWAASLLVVASGCGSSAASEGSEAPGAEAPLGAGSLSARSSAPAAFPAADPGAPAWRVLSFNLNYGVGHEPVNVAAVADADADLVLLQETTDASERAFREALGDAYPHMRFRQCCNAGGLGVLSKHPIREEDYFEPTVGWFPAWRVVVESPLGPVQVLDVHLRPPMSDGGSWAAGYFTTRSVRREEIEDFWALLDPDLPTVVAGDFNENAKGKAVEFLEAQGLVSALATLHPRAKTWHWPTRVGEIHGMLDHVMFGDLSLFDAQVLERGSSDHYPVLAVLGPKG